MMKESSPEQREGILARLDEIEDSVNGIRTPLSFADQLYVLREHIGWVRHRLTTGMLQRSERLAAVDLG